MAVIQQSDEITETDIGSGVNAPGLVNNLDPQYIAEQATASAKGDLPTFDQFISGEYTGIGSQRNLDFVNMNVSNLPSGVRGEGFGKSSVQLIKVDDLRKSLNNTPRNEWNINPAYKALSDLYNQATQKELYARAKAGNVDPAVTVPIAGVDMASGQITAGEDTTLGEFAKSRLKVYDIAKPIGQRIQADNPSINQDYINGILVNKFSTGDIYKELFRGVKDVARVPMYSMLLTVAAKDLALASTPFYTWEQGQGGRARAAQTLRKFWEDTLGSKYLTVDSHMNGLMHEFIKEDLL